MGSDALSNHPASEGDTSGASEVKEDEAAEILRRARHDFKSPLTSLRMLAQMFEMAANKGTLSTQPERVERNSRMIMDQVDKLVTLADTFSDIALFLSGKLKLNPQSADARAVLQEAAAQSGAVVKDIDVPNSPVWVQWDTSRMIRALKYVISEAKPSSVSIKAEDKGEDVRIRFKESPKPESFRNQPSLYFVRAVVEEHGGSITEDSEIVIPAKPVS